ncbi:hypothetical protein C5E51_03055 [Nocardia nova]|uniref:Uncharacterized protein n=1 Tax=Nocardia nova TaxID=37330 RepID=A0A2S6A2B8_9NOCA|nr:hypothetical protein C5E46_03175 [Nocardia nova]PPJ12893.1 hypothetical protein C5E51_03055 [Nocardia nova]PPJ25860.1 hypothetical protein C5F51_21330 [Nocardia nova]
MPEGDPVNAMNSNDVGNPPAPPGPDTGRAAPHDAMCGGGHGDGDGSEPRGGVESADRRSRDHRLRCKHAD